MLVLVPIAVPVAVPVEVPIEVPVKVPVCNFLFLSSFELVSSLGLKGKEINTL